MRKSFTWSLQSGSSEGAEERDKDISVLREKLQGACVTGDSSRNMGSGDPMTDQTLRPASSTYHISLTLSVCTSVIKSANTRTVPSKLLQI